MIPQIVARLSRLDYPADRLRGFLVIEADDGETIAAAQRLPASGLAVGARGPAGRAHDQAPRAEHRSQPRRRRVWSPSTTPRTSPIPASCARRRPASPRTRPAWPASRPRCASVRPPIRPVAARSWTASSPPNTPPCSRWSCPPWRGMGLPFPLGGTSNHFRVDVLRQVGGWDPWNVTEDADLGYRLWRRGWRLGVMSAPTWETPPGDLHTWLPQRTRWLKGFMQTWLVHMRRPLALGWRGLLSLHLTLALALVAAALHAVSRGAAAGPDHQRPHPRPRARHAAAGGAGADRRRVLQLALPPGSDAAGPAFPTACATC